jgi:hypothetical protein
MRTDLVRNQFLRFSPAAVDCEQFPLRLVVKCLFKNVRKPVLPRLNPARVVFADDFLCVADQFGAIPRTSTQSSWVVPRIWAWAYP